MISSGNPAIDEVLEGGYPERSAVLVEGPTSNEKEVLGYEFLSTGLNQGDFCLYVTRLSSVEIINDSRAFGYYLDNGTFWMSPEGGEKSYIRDDLANISFEIKSVMKSHGNARTRIVFDLTSQLLMSNPSDSVFKFFQQLLTDLKNYDATIIATVQDDMHQPQTIAGLELLFDGVLAVRRSNDAEAEVRVKQMRGTAAASSSVMIPVGAASAGLNPKLRADKIAILPFVNMGPDPRDEYIADGLTDEVIASISRMEGIGVISRTSVMQYKNSQLGTKELAKELGAGTIVEGSIRKSGDKVRITVQLIDATRDEHMWVQSWDRHIQDMFAIQSDISRRIATSLKARMVSPVIQPMQPSPQPVQERRFCRFCGSKVTGGAKFCRNCGRQLTRATA